MAHLLLWLLAPAQAQTVPTAQGNVQLLRPSVDATRTLWTDDATRSPDGYVQAKGLLSYTHRPLVWEWSDGRTEAVVGSAWQLDVIGAVSFFGARVGLDVPVLLGGASDVFDGGAAGLGDVALDAKYTVLDPRKAPLGVAATARLSVPTATVDVPLGDDGPTAEIAAVVDKEVGPVLLAANLGTRFSPPTEIGPTTVDDQLVYRLGAGWELTRELGVLGELTGRVGYTSSIAEGAPLEGTLGGWAFLTDALVARAGVGVGMGRAVGTPGARAIVSLGWEPTRVVREVEPLAEKEPPPPVDPDDVDGDGLRTANDECPDQPEDDDGYEDDDGCPEAVTLLGIQLRDASGATAQGASAMLTCGADFEKRLSADQSIEVPAGACTVEASGAGWATARVELDVADGPPVEEIVTVEATGETGRVTIRVFDPNGAAVEQSAWAFDEGGFTRIHEGSGASAVSPGTHTVRVGGKGFELAQIQVEVKAGEEVPLDIVLQPKE